MLVTAYHGTDEKTARKILAGGFKAGLRGGLWLGKGVYFFQEAPGHALAWAETVATRSGRSGKATVIKVEIDISNCLDLIDNEHWAELKDLSAILSDKENLNALSEDKRPLYEKILNDKAYAEPIRKFRDLPAQPSLADYLQNPAEIDFPHFQDYHLMTIYLTLLANARTNTQLAPSTDSIKQNHLKQNAPDCIRAIFPEGKPIFKNSWLFDQSAIILCVLNPEIIANISRTDS